MTTPLNTCLRRGRMISTPHRQTAISLIDEAVIAGARRAKACAELEISDRHPAALDQRRSGPRRSAPSRAAALTTSPKSSQASRSMTELKPPQKARSPHDQKLSNTRFDNNSILIYDILMSKVHTSQNNHPKSERYTWGL